MTDTSKTSGKAAVVLLSGGLDSMVSAAIAQQAGFDLFALTIDYGQRHRIELQSAKTIAAYFGCKRHVILPLDLRAFGGSALTDDISVPKDGGKDRAETGGNKAEDSDHIPVTYVPARNLVFLSLTLAWAEVTGAQDIFIGVNALDYSGYPDCRPEFITSFAETARLGTKAGVEGAPFTVHTPLKDMSKGDIAAQAHRFGLDTGMSWSCYDPTSKGFACGQCDSCRLRQKGFAEAGLEDGIPYAK